jgi:adenylylsulfate kinase-like enzyme
LAREGKIKNFTGIDDPYEAPQHPEIVVNTTTDTAEDNADKILSFLINKGFVSTTMLSDETVVATGHTARI